MSGALEEDPPDFGIPLPSLSQGHVKKGVSRDRLPGRDPHRGHLSKELPAFFNITVTIYSSPIHTTPLHRFWVWVYLLEIQASSVQAG